MKNIGSLSIFKGTVGGIQLKMWDAIPQCDDRCDLWDECVYEKKKKCALRKAYINSVIESFVKALEKKDEVTMMRVGLLLMPLYTNLINLKLASYDMNGRVRYGKGVDPVMKEMRETIKQIDGMLVDLGLAVSNGKGKVTGKPNNFLDGDGDYYDELINGREPA